jgi:hypothetical protein
MTLLPQPPDCWDYRCDPPGPALSLFSKEVFFYFRSPSTFIYETNLYNVNVDLEIHDTFYPLRVYPAVCGVNSHGYSWVNVPKAPCEKT